jgi:hypothetical protein
MAKKNRVDLNAVIQANLPDNTIDFITPALDREVEIDEVDSCFNLEDDTAVDVNYAPTTPADWGGTLPTEVGDGLDILIKKVSTNASQTIAYVATNGSDVVNEYEIGNPLKPFATFLAAWNAMPSSNFIIKSLGGNFTITTVLLGGPKSNFLIDLNGTTINGTELRVTNSNNGIIKGGTINAKLNVGATNSQKISVIETNINGQLNLGELSYVNSCRISNPSTYAITTEITQTSDRPFVSNCSIISSGSIAVNAIANFSNCFIQGSRNAIQPPSNTSATFLPKFSNCTIIGEGLSNQGIIYGVSANLNAIFKQCRLESTVGVCVWVGNNNSNNVFFEDCDIIAQTNCVVFQNSLIRNTDTRTTFKRCSFYSKTAATTGEIFIEQGYNVSDLGKTQVIGTTLYNKSFTTVDAARFEVLGDQITVTDAQIPVE